MTRKPLAKSSKQQPRKSAKHRPPTREPSPDDDLYEIRDIIDEKRVKGKLLYKVDWADNPTTGESYDPTWEPAKNVTEVAVADWEREKRRRQGLESTSSSAPSSAPSSTQSDSQPVLPPNWKAKRRREDSVVEEEERAERRLRRSVDSGYTSTQSNDERSRSLAPSPLGKKAAIVLELAAPPGFDPSEYRKITPSQSVSSSQCTSSQPLPSSQDIPLGVIASLQERISQRTIPDSQDYFESLRTQSTAQSVANHTEAGLSEEVSQPIGGNSHPLVGGSSQVANLEDTPSRPDSRIPSLQPEGLSQASGEISQPAAGSPQEEVSQSAAEESSEVADSAGQTSRSDFDIPSRQPEGTHQDPRHSFGLLETHSLSQSGSPRPEEPPAGENLPSDDGPWSGRFLTQPELEIPIFSQESDLQAREAPSADQSLNQADHQDHEPNSQNTGSPRSHHFASATESPLQQAAQRVSALLGSHPEQLFTQISENPGQSEEVVPDTVQREARKETPDQAAGQRISTPQRRTSEASRVGPVGGASRPSTPAKGTTTPLFFTPNLFIMDDPSGNGTPRSAVDLMRQQLQASVFGSSPAVAESRNTRVEPPLLSPSLVLSGMDGIAHGSGGAPPTGHPISAAEAMNRGIGIGMPAVAGTEYEQPQTVAPSDLTTSIDHIPIHDDAPSAGDQQIFGGGSADSIPIVAHDDSNQSSEAGLEDQEGEGHQGEHFIVTLPMAANSRSIYLDTISENKATMIEFGDVFADSDSSEPGAALVARMDSVFERLLELCDLPAYDESPLQLRSQEMMKHATNSNSKFSFVYEFLNGLSDINVRILILSQPGRVFEYLEAVVSAAGFTYTILGQEASTGQQSTGGVSVILGVAGQDLSRIQGGVDVVLVFDHAARSVELPASLGYESMAPIILTLLVSYSLEHIDHQLLQLEPDLDGLERKNALNLAVAAAKEYLRNPKRDLPEPHAVAEIFANFLKNPDSGLDWEPHAVPDGIFDMWLTQERSQEVQNATQLEADLSVGRKRPNENIDEGTPKRPRLLLDSHPIRNITPARMSELLKRTLAGHPIASGTATPVEVPVEKLERMADKIAELEARLASQNSIEVKLRDHLTSLESQLRSNERTIQTIEPKFADALRDRAAYEKECKAAVEKATAATERLEAQKSEVELLKSKLADAHAAMANSSNPDLIKLAQTVKERDEALATIEKLEKKVRVAQNDLEYSRKAYQDASNAHTELSQENRELKAKAADLERRASENLLRIHQIHAQNESAAATKQIDDLRALVENRERELDRAMQELRILKNGRRETRGSSVPRSPRTVLSPRPGRGGAVGAGAGSRGTSPAPGMSSDGITGGSSGSTPLPGMTYFQPVGNGGRWGHLRD